jgi:hypothetical protein
MRKLSILVLAVVGGLLAMLVLAPPASAYSGPLYHTYDYAKTYYTNDDIIQVCDREADGHGVYAEYYLSSGAFKSVVDGNGSAAGCGVNDWTAYPWWVTRYRVCERYVSCTGWAYTDGIGGS